jgi:hypothetical protein
MQIGAAYARRADLYLDLVWSGWRFLNLSQLHKTVAARVLDYTSQRCLPNSNATIPWKKKLRMELAKYRQQPLRGQWIWDFGQRTEVAPNLL